MESLFVSGFLVPGMNCSVNTSTFKASRKLCILTMQ